MGAFNDSLKIYPALAGMLAHIGDVRVGEVTTLSPCRRARIHTRNMWYGSLTSTTEFLPRAVSIAATERIDSLVVRP
jgi:hypothetical protein